MRTWNTTRSNEDTSCRGISEVIQHQVPTEFSRINEFFTMVCSSSNNNYNSFTKTIKEESTILVDGGVREKFLDNQTINYLSTNISIP